jgi:hypothetical protein
MLTPRWAARLGLFSACGVLALSLAILVGSGRFGAGSGPIQGEESPSTASDLAAASGHTPGEQVISLANRSHESK